ncbi:hypothetical protein L1049_010866 [Liquidambar formosana]|uniref:Uncharacterized protein n=1 Tax=Liquidambar formosana TaxID=63359 RepID=A0AAP0RUH6_LIQFO
MKNIGYWVCGVVLSSLCADGKPCLEMEKLAAGGFVNSSFIGVDSSICKELMEKGGVLKEVKEVNDAVASLEASIVTGQSSEAAEELQRRLEVFEKLLDGLGKEVDHLFADVLAWRNKLLDSLRLQKG